jgi:hypothetical protein
VPFLVGLAIGGFILFFYKTPQQTIMEYPHPDNVKDRVYRDKNGVCYSYTSKEVNCDENEGTLRPYPLQG